jgi:hypothetical protein
MSLVQNEEPRQAPQASVFSPSSTQFYVTHGSGLPPYTMQQAPPYTAQLPTQYTAQLPTQYTVQHAPSQYNVQPPSMPSDLFKSAPQGQLCVQPVQMLPNGCFFVQ